MKLYMANHLQWLHIYQIHPRSMQTWWIICFTIKKLFYAYLRKIWLWLKIAGSNRLTSIAYNVPLNKGIRCSFISNPISKHLLKLKAINNLHQNFMDQSYFTTQWTSGLQINPSNPFQNPPSIPCVFFEDVEFKLHY